MLKAKCSALSQPSNDPASRCKIKGSMAAIHFMYSIGIHASDKPDSFSVTKGPWRQNTLHTTYVFILVINKIVSHGATSKCLWR